ncbi:hypothetical protein VT84_37115 [Gemmata sp. SH-PL17]|uniref:hypothetical protein n=1 Tax=Gemmata sp. SH-PL17 TaxID=1630693 RepID=UPI00078DC7C6|nr:hypothetical protein [Gemmata sp. SH-PL17]AMV30074.1 hypothetical protein VT84_37115 [Gemmata sp. SH-PL17]
MPLVERTLEHIRKRAPHLSPFELRELAEQLAEEAEALTDMADDAERDSYFVDDPDLISG